MAHEADSANINPLASTVAAPVVPTGPARDLQRLLSFTSQLFGGDVSVFEDYDPEHPSDRYTVLAVTTSLDPAAALEAELEWIRALRSAGRDFLDLRLSIRFPG